MTQPIIYHNPSCSKSTATLALLVSKGHQPEVVLYLETPPSRETLLELARLLSLPLRDLIRGGESAYQSAELDEADDERLLAAIAEHPILLQRPIVRMGNQAAIGRPPENVLRILDRHDN